MARLPLTILALLCAFSAAPARAQYMRYNANLGVIEQTTANKALFANGYILASGYISLPELYAEEYFRNTVGGTGIWNTSTNNRFYATSASTWNITGANSYPRLRFRSGGWGTTLGWLYTDASGFGLRTPSNAFFYLGTGASFATVFPNNIQIGTYGGITPSPSSYGTIAMNIPKGGYYGFVFGNYTNAPTFMGSDSYVGWYNHSYGQWNYIYYIASNYMNIYGSVNFNDGIYVANKPALTKVVTQVFCASSGWRCSVPACPASSRETAYSCNDTVCYRHCCWGTDP